MIRGMSYDKGIFFMNHDGIAHATLQNNRIISHFYSVGLKGYLFIVSRLILSLPFYVPLLAFILLLFITQPEWLFEYFPKAWNIPPLPIYSLILFSFGYHFIFPLQLKKYHGAEHKVFSYQGRKHLVNIKPISKASIVNRNCSTNSVVLIFLVFFLIIWFVNGWIALSIALLANFLIPRYWKWADQKLIFPISSFIQRIVTTAPPDEEQVRVAILSYMTLIAKKPLDEEQVWNEYHAEQERLRHEREEKLRKIIEEQQLRQAEELQARLEQLQKLERDNSAIENPSSPIKNLVQDKE